MSERVVSGSFYAGEPDVSRVGDARRARRIQKVFVKHLRIEVACINASIGYVNDEIRRHRKAF